MAGPAWPLASGLDPTFDDDGIVLTPVSDRSSGHDVVVQPDGRIVVVGSFIPSGDSTQPVLVRYLSGGGIDPSFGGDGIVVPPMAELTTGDLNSVALGPGGTLVTGGVACVGARLPSAAPW